MNIVKLREIGDSLFDEGKYEDAYYVYDEIYNQIWSSLGVVQNGLTEFSQSYLGNSYKSNYEFRDSYTNIASNNIFKKSFNLDPDQTLNEFTFTTHGHLQCVCYSPKLNSEISVETIYNEFLVLHSLVLETENENWIDSLLKLVTPTMEGKELKRLRPLLSTNALKKRIIENSDRIKKTDWFNVNVTFLDYLFNTGDNNSELYSSIYKIVGFHFKQKTHRKKTSKTKTDSEYQNQYESYESYEKYEKFEKHTFKKEDEFDPTTATEFEKAKYYGKLLDLTGKVSKSQVRKKYLELIAKYHPDKVFDLGDELKILAEKKTKQFNLAYEWMKKKYNI
jgi:hypothetical protein